MRGPCLALLALSAAHGYDNGSPNSRLPVLGWSSWVALGPGAEHPVFDYCDATNVKNAIDAFFEVGLWDAGYRHFHLDDCWAGGRHANGSIYPDPTRFPNGMKKVVDHVHSLGLVFGLYTCAGGFAQQDNTRVLITTDLLAHAVGVQQVPRPVSVVDLDPKTTGSKMPLTLSNTHKAHRHTNY